MKIKKDRQEAVSLFETLIEQLAMTLTTKTKPFLFRRPHGIPLGALPAIPQRRTVTQRLLAARISDDYRQVFYHIPHNGRKGDELFDAALKIILERLGPVIATLSLDHLTKRPFRHSFHTTLRSEPRPDHIVL